MSQVCLREDTWKKLNTLRLGHVDTTGGKTPSWSAFLESFIAPGTNVTGYEESLKRVSVEHDNKKKASLRMMRERSKAVKEREKNMVSDKIEEVLENGFNEGTK